MIITNIIECFANRDQDKCPSNRGDNYKDYMSIFPARTRRSVSLMVVSVNRGDNYKDYMRVLLARTRRGFSLIIFYLPCKSTCNAEYKGLR